MRIIYDFPPLYDEINRVFGLDKADVLPIFAWGQEIFNPHRVNILPALHAHEVVHGQRQGSDVVGWWRRYMADAAFRLEEELHAHVAEYEVWAAGKPRNLRRQVLTRTAVRLAAPLYGYKPRLTQERARALLQHALREAA